MKKVFSEKFIIDLESKSIESLEEVNRVLKKRLSIMRENGDLTMSGLVRATGINEAHLYQWLRGDYQLSRWVTIKKVAEVLGIKLIIKE